MKKIIFTILLVLVLIVNTSCNEKLIQFEDKLTLTVPAEYLEHFVNQDSVPSLDFKTNGTINVAGFSTSIKYLLTKNDNYKISDEFEQHLSRYNREDIIITKEDKQMYDDKFAKFGSDKLPIDSPERYSKEYLIVATDTDGTRYSYEFRTFVSNNKRYYTYKYSTNMTITMEMPLMVIGNGENNLLTMLPLPYDTIYKVHSNIEMDKLINGKNYLDEKYYTFDYPAYLKDLEIDEQTSEIKKWYEKYCGLYEENDKLIFRYLGINYELILNVKKIEEETGNEIKAFKIIYAD